MPIEMKMHKNYTSSNISACGVIKVHKHDKYLLVFRSMWKKYSEMLIQENQSAKK